MSSKLYVVGNKVEIPDGTRISQHDSSDKIVFVGKMNYAPNELAVTHFADHVFPTLCLKYPSLKFIIVGAKPTPKIMKLAERRNIIVTGYVESVEPYYRDATIVVAPMLTGAGIQNKIIQAMAYGCCVATTPLGADGISIECDEIGIFDGDDAMIAGLLNLLEDENKRKKMGGLARGYVMNNLSEDIIAQQFWDFILRK